MNLVTGGTGFIGAHVVRALLARGRKVRCLVRSESRRSNLEGLNVEIVVGDVTDPASLVPAMQGVATVFHCAADYRLSVPDPRPLFECNVGGTENVMRAASQARVGKVVHTSSVGALGRTADGSPATEDTPVAASSLIGPYKRSKYEAERVAEQWSQRGLPVVIVNPSTPVGELDVKPTPTGQMIVDFLNRRMPAYVDTGLNLVDVRDVAEGHILAAERGRVGQKYILGNRDMTLKEILDALSRLTGIPSPRIRLPHWIPLTAAAFDAAKSRITGRAPRIPLEGVRMSRYRMFFDPSKAVRELGLARNPVDDALARAIAWFRENSYARG
jgi:dihydroflavonol-4-reductase